jgi:hypothetical protein
MNRCTTAHSRMLQRVLTHKSVFYSAADDGIKNEGDIATPVLEDPKLIVLMPHKNTAFIFIGVNHIMYEMHVAIIEGDTRKNGVKHAISAARWMFNNTPCQKLITYVPEVHDRSIMFAKVCGMEQKAVLQDSLLKNGKLENLVLLDATKDKFIKLHGEM